jgi:integrase
MASRGSVYRRGATWTAHVTWGTGSAKRQVKKGGHRTRKEAQATLVELLASVEGGTFVAPSKLTVGRYLDAWLAGRDAAGLRPSTIVGYRHRVDVYVTPRLGAVPLQGLSAIDLDRFYATLAREGLSLSTVRGVHAVLSKALADAERQGVVARNVARLATPPKSSATRAPEMTVWTPGELAAFLGAVEGHRYGPLMRTAAMTGLRRSEFCGLRWGDIDLEAAALMVRQSVQLVDGRITVGAVKTSRSRRRVDLDAGTVAVLRAHRRTQASERLMVGAGWRDHDLVFTAPDGGPLNPDTITQWFDRTVRRSELGRIRLHDLRHTHATHLLAAGVNVKVVSERLGHASVAFTLDTYGHVMPGQQASAAAAVAALVD